MMFFPINNVIFALIVCENILIYHQPWLILSVSVSTGVEIAPWNQFNQYLFIGLNIFRALNFTRNFNLVAEKKHLAKLITELSIYLKNFSKSKSKVTKKIYLIIA